MVKTIILFLLFISVVSIAQTTVIINPVKDNTLFESGTGALSDGAGVHFFAGKTNNGLIRRALLKFDISANVPVGATITSVNLTLNMNKTSSGAQNVAVHSVNADWGEGASDGLNNEGGGAASQSNDATWIHRFFSGTMWTAAGGDFNATGSATVSISSTGDYSWNSVQLLTDVQNWYTTPGSNFGWILIGNESASQTTKRFASRENPTIGNRPRLSITYTSSCNVNTEVTQNGLTLTATASPASYQWVDCDNANAPIANETGQSFTPATNGNFAVEVTENSCTDVSDCFDVVVVGVIENDFESQILVYPNPGTEKVMINLGKPYPYIFTELIDAKGQSSIRKAFDQRQVLELEIQNFSPGAYFIRINAGNKQAVVRIVKE